MLDDTYKKQLDDLIGRTNEFIGYSVDKISGVRNSAMTTLRSVYDELDQVRSEIGDIIAAGYAITDDEGTEADTDFTRRELAERERILRLRRNDLDRMRVRVERVLSQCTGAMERLHLALEVINNRVDTPNSMAGLSDVHGAIQGLQFAERENRRLAREIHDGPIQQFAAIMLMFEYLERVFQRGDKDAAADEIDRIKQELKSAMADFRGFLIKLKPVGLDMGLGHAIRRLADGYIERGVNFIADVQQDDDVLPNVMRANIFRVVQEAASNAVRHGCASSISVVYRISPSELTVKIKDDGVGFGVEAETMMANGRGSHGLSNIRERVNFMNGTLRIDSQIGIGTEIYIKVPIGADEDAQAH